MNYRVLHVICPGALMGAERSVLASIRALLEAGVDTELLVMMERRVSEHGSLFVKAAGQLGLKPRVVELARRLDVSAFATISNELHQSDPAIVHAHGYKALYYLSSVRSAGSDNGAALVYSYHGATSHTLAVQLYERLELGLMKSADAIFAVSAATAAALEHRGIDPGRMAVVPNMLSRPIALSPPVKRSTQVLRLMYAGRLSMEKGLSALLPALHKVSDEIDVQLDVFGDGPLWDELEHQVQNLNLSKRVRLRGYIDDIWAEAGNYDGFVLPSFSEGMPMVLIEAQAAGLPIIATSVGGVPEMLRESSSALLVDSGDPGALANAILSLKGQLDTLRENARGRAWQIADLYSPGRWAARAQDQYQRLVGEVRKGTGS